jgi:hypothetical protein
MVSGDQENQPDSSQQQNQNQADPPPLEQSASSVAQAPAPASAPESTSAAEQTESLADAQQERRSGQTAAAAAQQIPEESPALAEETASPQFEPPNIEPPNMVEPGRADSAAASALDSATAQAVLADSRRHTRRSFVVAAAATAAAYFGYEWLEHRPTQDMQPAPYRVAYQSDALLSRTLFHERALAPTYPLKRAENLRVNGVYGLKQMLEPASYRLQLVGMRNAARDPRYVSDVTAWQYRYIQEQSAEDPGHDTKTAPKAQATAPPASAGTAEKMAPAPMLEQEKQKEAGPASVRRGREEAGQSRSTLPPNTPGLLLTMDDLLKLPRHELVTQFKCIEGWSQVVHWAGVRMADFLDAYPPASIDGVEPRYVYMETPDGDYYVGYDMAVCRHPQTLLVTEMMGQPLTQFHGAPLRVHMPTKYGYKQIKRVGLICYTNSKPDDYWTRLGYDWYAGL